jgi:metal-sulfur cluster biosynthetic enzyme
MESATCEARAFRGRDRVAQGRPPGVGSAVGGKEDGSGQEDVARAGFFRGYSEVVPTAEQVREALHQVEDPELGMDIVELGLVYDVDVEGPKVTVTHSLTSMGCPAGPMIQEEIVNVTRSLEGVEDVEIELTWDPPWTPERMSDDAKFILGFG